mmetsp:Transcript_125238/g.389873  ORF Transcript_125238/g.389873 Transcript_125238/m.389873 type:complete len:438 (-) Transcript_125238:67-1380(-)
MTRARSTNCKTNFLGSSFLTASFSVMPLTFSRTMATPPPSSSKHAPLYITMLGWWIRLRIRTSLSIDITCSIWSDCLRALMGVLKTFTATGEPRYSPAMTAPKLPAPRTFVVIHKCSLSMYQCSLRPRLMNLRKDWLPVLMSGTSNSALLDAPEVSRRHASSCCCPPRAPSSHFDNSISTCCRRLLSLHICQKVALCMDSTVRRPNVATTMRSSRSAKVTHACLALEPVKRAEDKYMGPRMTSNGAKYIHRIGNTKWLTTTNVARTNTRPQAENEPLSSSANVVAQATLYNGPRRHCKAARSSNAPATMPSCMRGPIRATIAGQPATTAGRQHNEAHAAEAAKLQDCAGPEAGVMPSASDQTSRAPKAAPAARPSRQAFRARTAVCATTKASSAELLRNRKLRWCASDAVFMGKVRPLCDLPNPQRAKQEVRRPRRF